MHRSRLKDSPRLRRFYVAGPLVSGVRRLEGSEAHHLTRVLRIGRGDQVTLFDGSGFSATAQVTDSASHFVQLTVSEPQTDGGDRPEIILAAAVPKGERFAWMIEKATELGITRFVPLITERSVVAPGEGKLEKMRRTIIETSKQCGRNRLMSLATPVKWPEFVKTLAGPAAGWIADPAGEPCKPRDINSTVPHVAAVGPEGGFTSAELDLAVRGGARLISLGPRILRIETAALVLASLMACSFPYSTET